jgi:RNA polymerase subunit RPABC4/transcription elongation factor Spt4
LARFRLRFLLQEFDLSGSETILGRSPDCQITIEDPLVSRQHARIAIDGDTATITDLGARNGVKVNGRQTEGEHVLSDGDRIRLGTQELVFTVVKARSRDARPTGFMKVCKSCNTPYPEKSPQCPHCGHSDSGPDSDEDTISGLVVEPKRSWTFQLLGEVIERAIAANRATEADRLMRRAVREVDERVEQGDKLDPNQVAMITGFALRLARLVNGAEWVKWSLEVHRRQGLIPTSSVIDRLEEIASDDEVRSALDEFLAYCRAEGKTGPNDDLAGLTRLEQLARR